jgi:hypothetical protein
MFRFVKNFAFYLGVSLVLVAFSPVCSLAMDNEGGEEESGEESGIRIGLNETWDNIRNGVRLVLKYNADEGLFKGTIENTTGEIIDRVRVEVHLSNGIELGPTETMTLVPGAKKAVELKAGNQKFESWTTHSETGSGEHGEKGEGGENGENGEHGRERGGEHGLI